MDETRAGGYISKLVFNNGRAIDIAKNDIIIFVGPNNAGKSQSLADIYALSDKKHSTIVISDIEISKYPNPVSALLKRISIESDQGSYKSYNVLGNNMNLWDYSDANYQKSHTHEGFRDLFIANLNTAARLTICNPPTVIDRNEDRKHPIHYAAFDEKYQKWLSENFNRAFGIDVIPNILFGRSIPLCIGKQIELDDKYNSPQEYINAYAAKLETYQQVQKQGDGIKSLTGILLYLMLDYYCTYLIDEPESFLHPPQAKTMGQIIGQTLTDDQQAFISTHSEEVIKGLLEVCPDRIKIIRITRKDNTNYFSILDSVHFSEIWNDPLLKYSNIMTSLFHQSVVLCESDSDCKMYSIIDGHIKQLEGKYSETLFIHCGGKDRMAKIASALRALNVNVKIIVDIDVLNKEDTIKGIAEAFDISWETINRDYNILTNIIRNEGKGIERKAAKATITPALFNSNEPMLSKDEIKTIQSALKTHSKWDEIKKSGINAIPSGDATRAFKTIDTLLREHEVYIVPVGELEYFIKEAGGHGPSWVNNVLEQYPDLNDQVYSQITEFIRSLNL